ncbi:MAG: PorT family protein [Muribaculaceae bacterium]|nr:PorT family protein [Muribaculaceae bacterium]
MAEITRNLSATKVGCRGRIGLFVRMALFAAFLAMWHQASAQTHYIPHVHVGAHAGTTLSNIAFHPSVKEKMLQGMQMGLSFRFAEERHVGLVAELNLEQRGWKEDLNDTPLEYSHRLTYIQLPILTHIFFGSRVVKGFFNLGPEVAYLIGDKVTSNFNYLDPEAVTGFPDDFRQTAQMGMKVTGRFDYGITAGAGVEFIIRRRHCIQLEGRYYYGLGNIFPSSKADHFSASRNTSILISLGYMFRIK